MTWLCVRQTFYCSWTVGNISVKADWICLLWELDNKSLMSFVMVTVSDEVFVVPWVTVESRPKERVCGMLINHSMLHYLYDLARDRHPGWLTGNCGVESHGTCHRCCQTRQEKEKYMKNSDMLVFQLEPCEWYWSVCLLLWFTIHE